MDKQLSKLETTFIQMEIIDNHQIQPKRLQFYQQQLKYSRIHYQISILENVDSIYKKFSTQTFLNRKQIFLLHNIQTWNLNQNYISYQNFKVGASQQSQSKNNNGT